VKNPENTRLVIAAFTLWIFALLRMTKLFDDKLYFSMMRSVDPLSRGWRIEHLQLISALDICPLN
jgi:hypothetical protein